MDQDFRNDEIENTVSGNLPEPGNYGPEGAAGAETAENWNTCGETMTEDGRTEAPESEFYEDSDAPEEIRYMGSAYAGTAAEFSCEEAADATASGEPEEESYPESPDDFPGGAGAENEFPDAESPRELSDEELAVKEEEDRKLRAEKRREAKKEEKQKLEKSRELLFRLEIAALGSVILAIILHLFLM